MAALNDCGTTRETVAVPEFCLNGPESLWQELPPQFSSRDLNHRLLLGLRAKRMVRFRERWLTRITFLRPFRMISFQWGMNLDVVERRVFFPVWNPCDSNVVSRA